SCALYPHPWPYDNLVPMIRDGCRLIAILSTFCSVAEACWSLRGLFDNWLRRVDPQPQEGCHDVGASEDQEVNVIAAQHLTVRLALQDRACHPAGGGAAEIADSIHAPRHDGSVPLADVLANRPRGAHRQIIPESSQGTCQEEQEDIRREQAC